MFSNGVEKEELEKYLKGQLEVGEEESEDTSAAPAPQSSPAEDVDSVALLESSRALKLTLLERFRALKICKWALIIVGC